MLSGPRRRDYERSTAVERMRQKLLSHSLPRAQMSLIVLLTGGCGLLASFVLLRYAGMGSMAVRYPLALAVAYLFFLFLIWLWLRTNAEDYSDVPDFADAWPDLDMNRVSLPRSGQGGDFGGGGATGDFSGPAYTAMPSVDASDAPFDSVGEAVGDAAGSVGEADEFAIPLLAIALAVGLAFAALYVVYIAPVLFAELLVDGALSYALFRHLRRHEPEHWLASTLRRTALPFFLTAVFLAAMGAAMSAYSPGVHTIGEFTRQVRTGNPP